MFLWEVACSGLLGPARRPGAAAPARPGRVDLAARVFEQSQLQLDRLQRGPAPGGAAPGGPAPARPRVVDVAGGRVDQRVRRRALRSGCRRRRRHSASRAATSPGAEPGRARSSDDRALDLVGRESGCPGACPRPRRPPSAPPSRCRRRGCTHRSTMQLGHIEANVAVGRERSRRCGRPARGFPAWRSRPACVPRLDQSAIESSSVFFVPWSSTPPTEITYGSLPGA